MSHHHIIKEIANHCAKESGHAWREGHKRKASGFALIAFGLVLLPIPFVGLPMIGYGIWKLCR